MVMILLFRKYSGIRWSASKNTPFFSRRTRYPTTVEARYAWHATKIRIFLFDLLISLSVFLLSYCGIVESCTLSMHFSLCIHVLKFMCFIWGKKLEPHYKSRIFQHAFNAIFWKHLIQNKMSKMCFSLFLCQCSFIGCVDVLKVLNKKCCQWLNC